MTTSHMYSYVATKMMFVFEPSSTIQARMFRFLTTFETNMSAKRDHPSIHFLTPWTWVQFSFSFYRQTQLCSLLSHNHPAHQYMSIIHVILHIKHQLFWNNQPSTDVRMDGYKCEIQHRVLTMQYTLFFKFTLCDFAFLLVLMFIYCRNNSAMQSLSQVQVTHWCFVRYALYQERSETKAVEKMRSILCPIHQFLV
jgi:hypothetical protein